MKKILKLFPILMLLTSLVALNSCNDDDSKSRFNLDMTDAPSDDANVEGVFVTVVDVKLDGASMEGFTTTTFDISAYQNGETKNIFSNDIDASSYNNVTLVLDHETDADGNSPGTYVLLENGTKDRISSSSTSELTTNINLEMTSEGEESYVIDFDLRKAIVRENEDETDYSMNSNIESSNTIRAVNEAESGNVNGNAANESNMEGQVIVYAYSKGSFNEETETSGQTHFANAVSSAKVESDGDFTLAFLEEGEYDIYFANYKDTDNNGTTEFEGLIELNIIGEISSTLSTGVEVSANAEVDLSLELIGLF
jgi:hypothetical protein